TGRTTEALVADWLTRQIPGNGSGDLSREGEGPLTVLLPHLGAVDLGYPTGADNEGIDADLARELGNSHEENRYCSWIRPGSCAPAIKRRHNTRKRPASWSPPHAASRTITSWLSSWPWPRRAACRGRPPWISWPRFRTTQESKWYTWTNP